MTYTGHAHAYMPDCVSKRKVRVTAQARAEQGAPTTIHPHTAEDDCTEECEYVRPADEETA